ncbi:MAG: hypothetical protein WCT08_04295 [Patescibacteria group bacterium]
MDKTISVILKNCARQLKLDGPTAMAQRLGIPKSTFTEWWNGKSVPRSAKHRRKLFELTGNALFNGPATSTALAKLLAYPESTAKDMTVVNRLQLLIQLMLPDLQLIAQDPDSSLRDKLRELCGGDGLKLFSTLARALNSETIRRTLIEEGHLHLGSGHNSGGDK